MKAWQISNRHFYGYPYIEIVFADSINEAKSQGVGLDSLDCPTYTEVRAIRAKFADDKEHLSEVEMDKLLRRIVFQLSFVQYVGGN